MAPPTKRAAAASSLRLGAVLLALCIGAAAAQQEQAECLLPETDLNFAPVAAACGERCCFFLRVCLAGGAVAPRGARAPRGRWRSVNLPPPD
jgi:hypothetical protein